MSPHGSRPPAITETVADAVLTSAPELLEMVAGAVEVADRTGRVLLLADVVQYAAGRWHALHDRQPTPAQLCDLVQHLAHATAPPSARVAANHWCREAMALVPVPTEPDPEAAPVTGLLALEGPAAEYLSRLLAGDWIGALRYVRDLIAGGMPLGDLLVDVLEAAEVAIGAMWAVGEATIEEEHFCTAVTERALADVYASLFTGRRTGSRLLAAHALSSQQNIGLRMVTDLLEAHGWTTSYVGGYGDAETLLDVLDSVRPDVLALSASMASQVPELMDVIARLRRHEAHHDLPIVVGGRPFLLDPGLAAAIQADGTARDAQAALELCTLLVERGRQS